MEPASDPSEDLEPNEFKISNYEDSELSDSSDDNLEALEPDILLEEPDNDFTLQLMNNLYEEQLDVENYSKYSKLLFGDPGGESTCPHCEFTSENLLELKIHLSKAHDGLKVYCIQCDYSAARRDTLLVHVRKIHEGRGFPCETCDYIAGTRQHLDRHTKHVHEGLRREKKGQDELEDSTVWSCDHCEYKTRRRYELKLHFATAHEGKRFSCSHCDFTAKRRDKINLHIKVAHEGLGKKCNFCDYKASTNQHLLRHLRSKHSDEEGSGIQLLKCRECGEEFSRQERLTEHIKKDHLECNDVGHESVDDTPNSKRFRYKCLECDFSSNKKGNLTEHTRLNHGGKKFKCDQCDFNCLTHGGLYLHQKAVHLGIRFKCTQCSYEGTQEVNLKRHIESKHGTIQYCCKLCNAKTKGLWYIETHLKKVHGIMDKTEYSKYLLLKEIDPNTGVSSKSSMSDSLDAAESSSVNIDSVEEDVEEGLVPTGFLDESMTEDDGEELESAGSPIDPTEFLDQDTVVQNDDAEAEDDEDVPDLELLEPAIEIRNNSDGCDDLKRKVPRRKTPNHRTVRWSCKLCGYVTNVKCSMIRHIQSIHLGWRYQCTFCDHEATQKGGLKYHIEKRHPGRTPVPKWSALEPVKSKSERLGILGVENMDVNDMFEEVYDYQESLVNQQGALNQDLSSSFQDSNNDVEENEFEDHDGLMFEPAVQIFEEDHQTIAKQDISIDEDLAGDIEDESASQYVGEDHDFSELFAKFNTNGEAEVQCDLCTYVTARVGNMRRHVSAAHQGIRFPCKLCSYRAPDKGSLMRHTRGVHEGIKFYCDFCSYSASQKGNLKKHVEMKHPDKEYACPYCNFKVNWKGSFIKHMQNLHGDLMSIHGLTSSNISQSLLTFNTSMSSLNESLDKSEDPSESYDKIPNQPPDEQNQSKEANTSTAEAVDPLEHFVVNRDTDELKLKQEERIVISPDLGSVAGNINPDACYDPENMTFDCPLCDFKAQSAASLARHNGAIHKGIRWKCKDCDFITRDKSSLKRHRRNRHDGIRFQCNYCDYDAGQKGNIKSHMDRRHPEIPYDHTEFQQVRVEKSKYTREPKRDFDTMGKLKEFGNNVNIPHPLHVHMLSSLLQAKIASDQSMSTDDDSNNREEDEVDFVHVVSSANCNDSYDDIAEESDYGDDMEDGGDFRPMSLPSSPRSNEDGIHSVNSTSTPIKQESHSILLSALQSAPHSSSSPTLTPRKSLLDLAASSNLLEMLKNKTPPRSPPIKSKRYNHGSPTIPTEFDPEATISCPECDYMARSQGTLFRHIQAVHRGVRYYCKLCDFVTIDKGSLKRHVNGQHEGIKHKCDFCEYENAQIGNVKKHIETKHQNIVYQCPYCELKAKHKWYLEQHVKKIHIERVEEFDVKNVSPTVDQSITTRPQHLSPDANLFLEMFGHHPMAQFFVPDTNKTGGGAEDDIAEHEMLEHSAAKI